MAFKELFKDSRMKKTIIVLLHFRVYVKFHIMGFEKKMIPRI